MSFPLYGLTAEKSYTNLWRVLTHSHDTKFTYKFDKENISFLDLNVISSNIKQSL